MARLTVNMICNAITDKYGVNREYLSMCKKEGMYCWVGSFSELLTDTEMSTQQVRLGDRSFEQWVKSFDNRIKKEQEVLLNGVDLSKLNEVIEDLFDLN